MGWWCGACTQRCCSCPCRLFFFFFNDTATTEIYTLSLHDALPISRVFGRVLFGPPIRRQRDGKTLRSEEHTSELQSLRHLVCRLLLALPIFHGRTHVRTPHTCTSPIPTSASTTS